MRRRAKDSLPPPEKREKFLWFRAAVALLVLSVLLSYGPPWERAEDSEDTPDKFLLAGTEFEAESIVSFEESVALLRQLSAMADALPPREFPPPTAEQLADWISQLVPVFEREGLVDHAEFPKLVQFADLPSWVTGKTSCQSDRISISWQLRSEFTEYTNTPEWLWTAAHETAHQAARLCAMYFTDSAGSAADPGIVESSATAAALEVTASMALEGNQPALYVFIYGLRDAAIFSLIGAAQREGRLAQLPEAVGAATGNPAWEYEMHQLSAAISGNPRNWYQSEAIAQAYGGRVIQYLLAARQDPQHETVGMLRYSEAGDWLFLSRTKLDATLYLIEHWDEYAAYLSSLQAR